jgi:8-oxo-dGTP diphosphatase
MSFSVSAKGIVIDEDNNLLVLKRQDDNPHMPGVWEPPGGRLELGENPFGGLKREVKEETGLDIEVGDPMAVRHFTRGDGQKIVMISFFCKPLGKDVKMSKEHQEFKWVSLDAENSDLEEFMGKDGFYFKEVGVFRERFRE